MDNSIFPVEPSGSLDHKPAPRVPSSRTISLGLNRAYASDWTVQDALRELYQNWKDAILQIHPLSLSDFVPHISESAAGYKIVVESASSLVNGVEGAAAPEVLGYIRYNKVQGSAKFTNLSSTLDPQCLEIGYTTKSEDDRLAGGHGEGLKITALVLC
ncbi:hypothetical protein BDW71DRAFT_211369 [Aspergillus fruticulosus]